MKFTRQFGNRHRRLQPVGPPLLGFGLLLLMLASPLALAKPDCETKPDHPSCSGTQDVPANATFLDFETDAVRSDGLGDLAPYIDGQDKVNCKIGRVGGFGLMTSNRATSGRMLCLYNASLGSYCGDPVNDCKVANMRTFPGPADDGGDLRLLMPGEEVETGFWINFLDNRQNFTHVRYDGVRVKAVGWDSQGSPTAWEIDTDSDLYGASARAWRVEDNQYVDPIPCGDNIEDRFYLPFHLVVELQ